MSNFDARSYASFWKNRNKKEKDRIRQRFSEAREEAEKIASRLIQEAQAQKVVLFGSVAEDNVKTESFDIDLAVFGGNWFRAQEIAEESTFKIDIVEYDDLPPHIKARIDEKGIILKES